jgi:Subtilisin inhibitor-like
MKLALVLTVLALAAVACGEDDEEAASPPALADLTVTVDRDGDGAAQPKTATVRCERAGASDACQALADVGADAFEPVSGTTACTEQYGGPQVATVKGTLRGKRVDARFSRENGCAIARWNAASRLLEAVG